MKIPKRDRETLDKFGVEVISTEMRIDQKGILAYHIRHEGVEYRWAVSSLSRQIPPWEFSKKPHRAYVYGKRLFIYRMFDIDGNLLYIGKTSQLDYRLYAHFYKNPDEWKKNVVRIDVCEFTNEADMHIQEMYLITKYSPIFNRDAVTKDQPTIILPELTFTEISDWK